MEEASVRIDAGSARSMAAERGEQGQLPHGRVRALDIGAPDVAARIADDDAVGKSVAVRIAGGER